MPIFIPGCWGAGHGGIRAIMDDMKLLSTEAEGVNEAIAEEHRKTLVNAAGRVGALLGLQSPPGSADGSQGAVQNGGPGHNGSSAVEGTPGEDGHREEASSSGAGTGDKRAGKTKRDCEKGACLEGARSKACVPDVNTTKQSCAGSKTGAKTLRLAAAGDPEKAAQSSNTRQKPFKDPLPTDGGAGLANAGVPDRVPDMPLTEVKPVNIKLLTLAELKLITDRGADGRRRLSELFAGPDRLVSSLHRASAV